MEPFSEWLIISSLLLTFMQSDPLDITGATNKFSIIVADWPFEDFDAHSWQMDIAFETGGKKVTDPCLLETSSVDKRIATSQFQTVDGIVSVQVLQFAAIDGVDTDVSAVIGSNLLVLTTPCFFVDMVYDPDFSLLLGGGATSGGCASNAVNKPLLNASIAALCSSLGFAALIIVGFVIYDKKKKYHRKQARAKAQQAYHTNAHASSDSSAPNPVW